MLRMATDFIWWHFQWSMSQNFIRETKQQRCIFLGFVFKIIPLSLYLLCTLKAFLEAAEMASTSLSAHKALLRWWMWVGGDPGNASGVWKWDTHLVYEPKDSRVNSSQGLFHLGSMVGVPGRSLGPAPYPGLRSLNCGQNPQAECVPGHFLQDPSVQGVLKSVLQVEVGVDTSGSAAGQGPESSRPFRWLRGKTGRPHTWPADSAVRECPVPPSLMDLITLSGEPQPGTQWGHFSPPCAAWAPLSVSGFCLRWARPVHPQGQSLDMKEKAACLRPLPNTCFNIQWSQSTFWWKSGRKRPLCCLLVYWL